MPKYIFILLITISMALSGDMLLKTGSPRLVPWAVLLYAGETIPIFYMYRLKDFGTLLLLWSPLGLIMGLAVSIFIYHEALTGRKIAAFALTLLAIAVMWGK